MLVYTEIVFGIYLFRKELKLKPESGGCRACENVHAYINAPIYINIFKKIDREYSFRERED
jgi:hypothetical protein